MSDPQAAETEVYIDEVHSVTAVFVLESEFDEDFEEQITIGSESIIELANGITLDFSNVALPPDTVVTIRGVGSAVRAGLPSELELVGPAVYISFNKPGIDLSGGVVLRMPVHIQASSREVGIFREEPHGWEHHDTRVENGFAKVTITGFSTCLAVLKAPVVWTPDAEIRTTEQGTYIEMFHLFDNTPGIRIFYSLVGTDFPEDFTLYEGPWLVEDDYIEFRGIATAPNRIPSYVIVHRFLIREKSVEFADPFLDAVIRAKIKKPHGQLMLSDIADIDVLDASKSEIRYLDGIEELRCLYNLNLSQNQIEDISLLAELPKLKYLRLEKNQISDISALSSLYQLQSLEMRYNEISDLAPLSGLTDLTFLSIGGNQVTDLTPLSGLTRLEWLALFDNQISDISPLGELVNLEWLELMYNSIEDISALAGLTNLKHLTLEDNNISDISCLAGLTNLVSLYLIKNNISDISALAGLVNLKALYIVDNNISSISDLVGLKKLEYLGLGGNPIEDISVLLELPNLLSVDLQDTNIDTSPGTPAAQVIDELRARGVEVSY